MTIEEWAGELEMGGAAIAPLGHVWTERRYRTQGTPEVDGHKGGTLWTTG